MAAIDWNDVLAVAADLTVANGVETDAQDMYLEFVNEKLNVSGFGGEDDIRLKLARIYMAAHLATPSSTAAGGSAVAGPVASEKEGGLSRSYVSMAAAASGSMLTSTKWGQLYKTMLSATLMGVPDVL